MPPPTKKPKKIKSKPRKQSAATTDKDKENIESVGPDQELSQCVNCNKTFESEYLLDTHKKECKKKSVTCSKCQQSFNKLSEVKKEIYNIYLYSVGTY